MNKKTRFLAQAGMIAALYVVLTHLQNFVWPESTSFAIQFRLSEALCVLAVMTPAAIPGLTIGCLVYNLTYIGALPLDWLIGSAATLLAALSMWGLRKVTIKGYPLPAFLMPALWNALLVGWELTVYIGDTFALNAVYVAIGEVTVLLILGSVLFFALAQAPFGAEAVLSSGKSLPKKPSPWGTPPGRRLFSETVKRYSYFWAPPSLAERPASPL